MTFFFCFLRSNDRTKTGVCFLSFLLRSLRLTKTVLKPKKAMQALFLPQWRAPRIWVLPKIVGRPTASIGRSPLRTPKEHRHAKLELKERAIFPVPLMVQDFDRRSSPNCTLSVQSRTSKPDYTWTATSTAWEILRTRCKQSSISFSKDEVLRKIKEIFSLCLWAQYFFPSFFFFFTFHRRTVELETDLATRQEKLKISRCTETCIGPTVGAVGPTVGASWRHRSSSFRNFANFSPRTKLFAPKQSLKTWLFKTPAKT